MKKFLLYVVLPLAIIVVGGLVFLQFFLGGVIKKQVNQRGPEIAQARVELGGAQLSPLTGGGSFSDLVVGNPKGWSQENLFKLEKIKVEVAPSSLWGDHIIVNELVIEGVKFNYETRVVSSNVGDLLKNIEQATSGGKDPTAKSEKGKPIKIEIRHFLLKNGSVAVAVANGGATLPIPTIELKDVGTGTGGVTPAQLSIEILRQVSPTLVATAATAMTKALPGTAGETVKQAEGLLKGLLGGKK